MTDTTEAAWAHYTRHPFDLTLREAVFPIPLRKRILPLASRLVEFSFNRRINHFERNAEHMLDWLHIMADDIATLYTPEMLPEALTTYTVPELGDFSWEQAGFTVTEDVPVDGPLFKHPFTREPLSNDPGDKNKVVLAAISSIDFLELCGYEII